MALVPADTHDCRNHSERERRGKEDSSDAERADDDVGERRLLHGLLDHRHHVSVGLLHANLIIRLATATGGLPLIAARFPSLLAQAPDPSCSSSTSSDT